MTQTLIEQLEKLIRTGGVAGIFRESSHVVLSSDLRAVIEQHKQEAVASVWNKGFPPHPYDKEWFIAKTKHRDRVVLKALPEEYSYDFKTADETYMKKEIIVGWMQFPDTEFKPFQQPDIIAELVKALEDDAHAASFQSMAGYRTALIAKVKGVMG